MDTHLAPDPFAELQALVKALVVESADLSSNALRLRRTFLGTAWVGPSSDQAADHIRSIISHIEAAETDIGALVSLVTEVRMSISETELPLVDVEHFDEDHSEADRPRVVGRAARSTRSTENMGSAKLSIYLSDDNEEALRRIRLRINSILQDIGYELPSWGEVHHGSVWQRGRAEMRRSFPKDELVRRLEKIERSLQVNNLDLPQSQANNANAHAVASITAAHAGVADVVLQLGSLVYVKWTDATGVPHVLSRTLSVRELTQFEAEPRLLSDANAALAFLRSTRHQRAHDAPEQSSIELTGLDDNS